MLLAPGAAHEVDARGASVLIGFLDPEGEWAGRLVRRIDSTIAPVPDGVVAQWRQILGDQHTLEARRVDAWVQSELLNGSRPGPIHPRVRRVLLYLRQEGLDGRGTSLSRLAQVAELSPSRLMHVFTTSLGIPIRPYLLRLRVQRAAGALAAGRTATEAAHLAGFADAPHLTRTFRRVFGMTPRELKGWIARGFTAWWPPAPAGSSPACSFNSPPTPRDGFFPFDVSQEATRGSCGVGLSRP